MLYRNMLPIVQVVWLSRISVLRCAVVQLAGGCFMLYHIQMVQFGGEVCGYRRVGERLGVSDSLGLSSWLRHAPWRSADEHEVENDQKFAHAGGDRELLGLAARVESFVEAADRRVVLAWRPGLPCRARHGTPTASSRPTARRRKTRPTSKGSASAPGRRGCGRSRSPNSANAGASSRPVLARRSAARAKSRIWCGLTTAAAMPARPNAATRRARPATARGWPARPPIGRCRRRCGRSSCLAVWQHVDIELPPTHIHTNKAGVCSEVTVPSSTLGRKTAWSNHVGHNLRSSSRPCRA